MAKPVAANLTAMPYSACRGTLPVAGVGSRPIAALQVGADVIDFEERDRRLQLSVGMKDLPGASVPLGPVGTAPAVLPVVGDDHELEHVVVQCLGHLVECLDIFVECRNR